MYRCLIIGYGSMGARHARLLSDMGHAVAVITHRSDIQYPLITKEKASHTAWDIVITATQTANHLSDYFYIVRSVETKRILLEKPAFHTAKMKLYHIPQDIQKKTFIGYNLRFHPVVLRALSIKKDKYLYSACFYVGQYLPDWRPQNDYRLCYSADTIKGGGVLRDLSHELDLACLFAGNWQKLTASRGQFSSLEISSDDVCTIVSFHDRCPHVFIHLNYLDRIKRRNFTLNFSDGTLHGDLVAQTLMWNGDIENFESPPDSMYRRQLAALLSGHTGYACTFHEGLEVLRMIDAAETAADELRWVTR
jgi:predicted dehydrogenase